MSKSLNKVILIGNLGADPEVRSAANSRVATLSVATGRQWKGADGQKQEKTAWHRVIFWNAKGTGQQLADIVEKYCKKGDKIYVEGEIEYRTWQDKEGQTRYSTEINGRELILLSGRGEGGEGGGGASWSGSRPQSAKPAASGAGAKKESSFDYIPEALDAEDDDLPF
jgi:single-strand DNA-binding protein